MPDMSNATVAEVTGKIMVAAIIILFLVLILMSFLHLYAKWFRWRTEEEEEATNPAREARRRRRFVFTPGQETVKRGLKPSVLRSLPVLVVDFNDGLECAVCLCEMVEGDKARMLPKCNHGFHVDCIDMWFESNSTCPLCRNLVVIGHESGAQMAALEDGVQNVVDVELNVLTLMSYPTNVLFWGNEVEVNTGSIGGEEGSNVAPTTSLASRLDEFADPNVFENSSSSSKEQIKSPLPMRLRTLKRLLSRDKRVLPSSCSCSVDLEQGMSRS